MDFVPSPEPNQGSSPVQTQPGLCRCTPRPSPLIMTVRRRGEGNTTTLRTPHQLRSSHHVVIRTFGHVSYCLILIILL